MTKMECWKHSSMSDSWFYYPILIFSLHSVHTQLSFIPSVVWISFGEIHFHSPLFLIEFVQRVCLMPSSAKNADLFSDIIFTPKIIFISIFTNMFHFFYLSYSYILKLFQVFSHVFCLVHPQRFSIVLALSSILCLIYKIQYNTGLLWSSDTCPVF